MRLVTLSETSRVQLLNCIIESLIHAARINSPTNIVKAPSASFVTDHLSGLALASSRERLPEATSRIIGDAITEYNLDVFLSNTLHSPRTITELISGKTVAM